MISSIISNAVFFTNSAASSLLNLSFSSSDVPWAFNIPESAFLVSGINSIILISDLIEPFKVVIVTTFSPYFLAFNINFWTLPGEKVLVSSKEPSTSDLVFTLSKSFIFTPDIGSCVVWSTTILLKVYGIGSWLYSSLGVPSLG